MNYYVYILISKNKTGWSYVGQTDNIKRRIKEHSQGKIKSTKGFRPLKLVYIEKFKSREESLNREKYLKSGIGREEKKKILQSGVV